MTLFHPTSLRSLLLGCVILLLGGSVILAQETRGTILGTVKDSAGAVVPGARVEITNAETNATTRLSTNDKGYFEAPYLVPGAYNISVTANGFKKSVQRGYALIAAVFAVLAGAEAYVEHLRGSFNQTVMWTPIWVTPPMALAAIGAACSEQVARDVLPVTSAVTFLDGLLGFGLHLQGIRRMPGGFGNLQFNATMGPPVFAPLLLCSVGLLGLIASLVRRWER